MQRTAPQDGTIACPRVECAKLPGFLNLAKLTSHLVDYHVLTAEAAQAEARRASDGPRPNPIFAEPRKVRGAPPPPLVKPCGSCHRVDGTHAPACRKNKPPPAGAGRHCRHCGEQGHRQDTCPKKTAAAVETGQVISRREVTLASGGGVITLHATLDIFTLSADDRRFVFGLVDALDGYQRKGKEKR